MPNPTRVFPGPLQASELHLLASEPAEMLPQWRASGWMFVRSGTVALRLLLRTLALPAGSRVLSSAFVCDDVRYAAEREGLALQYGDVRSQDWHLAFDPDRWARVKPAALILPHLYGIVHPQIDAIRQWSHAHKVPLIHDAAHCYGLEYEGTPIIDMDAGGFYSFGVGKSATAAAGALVRGISPDLAERLNLDVLRRWSLYPTHILRERTGLRSWPMLHRLKNLGVRASQLQVQAARLVVARLPSIEKQRALAWHKLCTTIGPDWLASARRQSYYKYLYLAHAPLPHAQLGGHIWRIASREPRRCDCPVYNNLSSLLYEISTESATQEHLAAHT